jgi:hypothetical protein
LAANGRMADWIPNWCFWFINWALSKNGGRCSFKLDWFAGKGIETVAGVPPHVATDVNTADRILSDHDPIVLDFMPAPVGASNCPSAFPRPEIQNHSPIES